MAERSNKSKSFLRESEYIAITNEEDENAPTYFYDKMGERRDTFLDLQYYFQKREDNHRLLFRKNVLLKITHEHGMNRNVVVNAINLQDYPFRKIKEIIKDIQKELKEAKIKGILEFHANDTTQSSYHFHFWTWKHYEDRAREFLALYMQDNKYASYEQVFIEGNFTRDIDRTSSKAIKKEINEKNIASTISHKKEESEIPSDVEENIVNKREERKKRINALNSSSNRIPISSKTTTNEEIFKKITDDTLRIISSYKEKTKRIKIASSPTSSSEIEEISNNITSSSRIKELDDMKNNLEEMKKRLNQIKNR